MTLREALLQYVTIRRALGTKLAEPERTLGQFVSFLERVHSGRGRDGGYPPPPAQIRTSGITAYGSCLRS